MAKKRPSKPKPKKSSGARSGLLGAIAGFAAAAAQRLDPKLRRLVGSLREPRRLKLDLARAFVASHVPLNLAAPPAPANLYKRVLVLLTQDAPPADLADWEWTRIVDRIFTVKVPLAELTNLAQRPEVKYIEAGRKLLPTLNTSLPETRTHLVHQPTGGEAPFDGTGVVVGIIDYGCDFTLDDFRNADGTTRIAFLWDQSLQPQAGEHAPAGFNLGVEYDEATINQALQQPDPFATVRHKPEPQSHGTHVMGIAVGNGRSGDANFPAGQYIGAAPQARIIFVQPANDDKARSFTDSVHVAEAMTYIFQRAQTLGLPCVINMSLGQNGGSHDGESVVERAIDRLLEEPGRAFVLAGGNEHIWRGHASGTLAAGQTRKLRWKVGGGLLGANLGDRSINEMELWYSSQDRFRVKVVDPDGEETEAVEPGQTVNHVFASGAQVFIDSERFTVLNGDSRIFIEMSPKLVGNDLIQPLPSGIWEVQVEALDARDGRYDAWIERDYRDRGHDFADQSFFVGASFNPFKTLGTPATARRAIAVANYDHVAEAPADSSGRGTTRDGRPKPEVAAPGTNIVSSNAMGGRPADTGVHPMRYPDSGTSMAAPHVAGIVALLLQRDSRLTASQIRKILIASARQEPGLETFDAAWGHGRVDARAAVDLVP